jgi:hypothetical protein
MTRDGKGKTHKGGIQMGNAKTVVKKEAGPVVDFDAMEGDTFVGKITNVSFGKTNVNQPDKEYVTLTMDVDYMDKPYDLFIPYSPRKQSVWANFLTALTACDVKIKSVNDLKGATFKFERKDIVLRGGFKAKEGFPIPIEHITE